MFIIVFLDLANVANGSQTVTRYLVNTLYESGAQLVNPAFFSSLAASMPFSVKILKADRNVEAAMVGSVFKNMIYSIVV